MVTDVNGMSHKPAGTVGGGQFEGKIGAASDDDLDAMLDSGADFGAARAEILKALREEKHRQANMERLKSENVAAYGNARVGSFLQSPKIRRDIARAILDNGAVSYRFPGWETPIAVTDEMYQRNHLDPSLDPDRLVEEWGERGVEVTFDGDTATFRARGDESAVPVKRRGCSLTNAPSEWNGLTVDEQAYIDGKLRQGRQSALWLHDGLKGLTEEDGKAIAETVKEYGYASIPLPEHVDPESLNLVGDTWSLQLPNGSEYQCMEYERDNIPEDLKEVWLEGEAATWAFWDDVAKWGCNTYQLDENGRFFHVGVEQRLFAQVDSLPPKPAGVSFHTGKSQKDY